jgi:hypothetical protein
VNTFQTKGLSIKNVSLHSFCVALRWAIIKKFPNNLKEWTPEQSEKIQAICEELDRRHKKRRERWRMEIKGITFND